MKSNLLKEQIEPEHIILILEELGCHHIIEHEYYISCANPDGDNVNAITVYKDTLKTLNHTRYKFNDYFQDLISLVQFLNDSTFFESIKFICNVCGIDYYYDDNESDSTELFDFIRYIEADDTQERTSRLKIISEDILNQYTNNPYYYWKVEGIDSRTQSFFDIRADIESERIIIPIRDEYGNLVGVKGRALNNNAMKYIYLYECPKTEILFGLDKTYNHIKNENQIIIVEAEKSVMKLYANGYKNAVALGNKHISEIQIEKILRLNVKNILICLDKDVVLDELISLCKSFDIGIKYTNIEYLYDKNNLLNEKESPMDNMNVFKILLDKFRYKYSVV